MNKYETVEEFLDDQPADKLAQIQAVRQIITAAHPKLQEHIKWNAPSYVLDGEDRLTFNLMNKEGVVKLVLHMGATRKEDKKGQPILQDHSGLIVWSSDIRGMITFNSVEEITKNKATLTKILQNWLAISATA